MYFNVFLGLLALYVLTAGFQKVSKKQVSHRHFQSLVMAKAKDPKPKPKLLSPLKISTIWARLCGEVGNEVFSVKCDPSRTTIDDFKKLIKLECSPTLNDIGAHKLVVKGADGNALRVGILLSSRSEGKSDEAPYIVEVPKIGSIKSLIMTIINITKQSH
jgi:hypothetical protein